MRFKRCIRRLIYLSSWKSWKSKVENSLFRIYCFSYVLFSHNHYIIRETSKCNVHWQLIWISNTLHTKYGDYLQEWMSRECLSNNFSKKFISFIRIFFSQIRDDILTWHFHSYLSTIAQHKHKGINNASCSVTHSVRYIHSSFLKDFKT